MTRFPRFVTATHRRFVARRLAVGAVALCITGCVPLVPLVPPTPPTKEAPRAGTPVAASFDKTWNAAVDVFALYNIPIRTIDKASGLIVAERMIVRDSSFADCGKDGFGKVIRPSALTWNVLVRADSAHTNVRANVFYESPSGPCSSLGKWESYFETNVKARAEGRAVASVANRQPDGSCVPDVATRNGEDMVATVYRRESCARHDCRYASGGLTMTTKDAIAACRAEALNAEKPPNPLTTTRNK